MGASLRNGKRNTSGNTAIGLAKHAEDMLTGVGNHTSELHLLPLSAILHEAPRVSQGLIAAAGTSGEPMRVAMRSHA